MLEVVAGFALVLAAVHDPHAGEAERAGAVRDAVVVAALVHKLAVLEPLDADGHVPALRLARQLQPLVVQHRLAPGGGVVIRSSAQRNKRKEKKMVRPT